MASASENTQKTGACAQRSEVHDGIECDGCGVRPIKGERYKCNKCYKYDLCGKCKADGVTTGRHRADHRMIRKEGIKVRKSFPGVMPHKTVIQYKLYAMVNLEAEKEVDRSAVRCQSTMTMSETFNFHNLVVI